MEASKDSANMQDVSGGMYVEDASPSDVLHKDAPARPDGVVLDEGATEEPNSEVDDSIQ